MRARSSGERQGSSLREAKRRGNPEAACEASGWFRFARHDELEMTMNKPPSARGRRKPLASFDGTAFHVEVRDRSVDVPAVLAGDDVHVELDVVTHWTAAEGESEAPEISIEDLGTVLDAIENAAEEAGLSIWFE